MWQVMVLSHYSDCSCALTKAIITWLPQMNGNPGVYGSKPAGPWAHCHIYILLIIPWASWNHCVVQPCVVSAKQWGYGYPSYGLWFCPCQGSKPQPTSLKTNTLPLDHWTGPGAISWCHRTLMFSDQNTQWKFASCSAAKLCSRLKKKESSQFSNNNIFPGTMTSLSWNEPEMK